MMKLIFAETKRQPTWRTCWMKLPPHSNNTGLWRSNTLRPLQNDTQHKQMPAKMSLTESRQQYERKPNAILRSDCDRQPDGLRESQQRKGRRGASLRGIHGVEQCRGGN